MNVDRRNPLFIVAGVLLFLIGIWVWITPQVIGNIFAVLAFFGGIALVGWALGFRVQR